MTLSSLTLIKESATGSHAFDVGISHALLNAVAQHRIGPVFRIHRTRPVVAFGMADRLQSGYPFAVRVAAAHGFEPVERLAGGRAAVFHEGTLAFSWASPQSEPRAGITERFELISSLLCDAFRDLGVDARIGEIPGEYCPGRYSVSVGGSTKVMGVGQRLVRAAAHVGGVIVVDGSELIRDVLIPVYRALEMDWDPRTTGALSDRALHVDLDNVTAAVSNQLTRHFDVESGALPAEILADARALSDSHVPRVA